MSDEELRVRVRRLGHVWWEFWVTNEWNVVRVREGVRPGRRWAVRAGRRAYRRSLLRRVYRQQEMDVTPGGSDA